MFREVLRRSKQLEIFRFLPRIGYFHHNGHSGSYPLAYPVKMGILLLLHIYFYNSLGGRGPLFEAWRATFGPRATGWEPLVYDVLLWCRHRRLKHIQHLRWKISIDVIIEAAWIFDKTINQTRIISRRAHRKKISDNQDPAQSLS